MKSKLFFRNVLLFPKIFLTVLLINLDKLYKGGPLKDVTGLIGTYILFMYLRQTVEST